MELRERSVEHYVRMEKERRGEVGVSCTPSKPSPPPAAIALLEIGLHLLPL